MWGTSGYIVDAEILKFVREFGLILFIFPLAFQVDPGFFSSFKKGGVQNVLAVGAIVLNVAVLCVCLFRQMSEHQRTCRRHVQRSHQTPALRRPRQAIIHPARRTAEAANEMASGYAAAYPLGVVGIIAAMFIIKALFRINVNDEIKAIEDEQNDSALKPDMIHRIK